MSATLSRELRRTWHHVRRRAGFDAERPNRLIVTKATWLCDARSPVMLMIDDLTNAWHSPSGSDHWEPGGDWGAGLARAGSAFLSLESGLLHEFPEVKVTFFTVAGAISAYTHDQPFSYAASLDADAESRDFFRTLAADPRFELAYHGFNHGSPGDRTESFVQEWQGFRTPAEAIEQTKRGLESFIRATGSAPRGGKYGGWSYNGFADAAVSTCGFLWWCRDWMPRDVSGGVAADYYEPQFFGSNFVVALPSTVHGHFWDRRQIDLLLRHRQIIAIEEHIAPVRPDGLTQTPNIIDDMPDLRRLYAYLRGKKVWHATGSEIAAYVLARERSAVYDVDREGFSIRYDGRAETPLLTLFIDCTALGPDAADIEVLSPAGDIVDRASIVSDRESCRHMVTIRVCEGRWSVRARAGRGED